MPGDGRSSGIWILPCTLTGRSACTAERKRQDDVFPADHGAGGTAGRPYPLSRAPLETEKDFRELRCKVGLVLQHAEDQLFCPTVLEDVAFGPLNLGCSQDEARVRAASTLERLGLAGFENRLTHRLSGGEKKLVSLATVLVMEPEALLLDEPTNGLDPEARQRIIGVLKTLPTARIIISHDWDFLAETSSEYLTVEGQHFTDAAPSHAHAHMHVHPLGNKPHEH